MPPASGISKSTHQENNMENFFRRYGVWSVTTLGIAYALFVLAGTTGWRFGAWLADLLMQF